MREWASLEAYDSPILSSISRMPQQSHRSSHDRRSVDRSSADRRTSHRRAEDRDDTPTLAEIKAQRRRLGRLCRQTPVWQWTEGAPRRYLSGTSVFLKLELFQYAGSFKPRGALSVMMSVPASELAKGVVTVSAGNHAMAVGYAARRLETTAKVVMPSNANPARVTACKEYGVEVELVEDVRIAFDRAREIEDEEGRLFVHPFEGPMTALGTATLGLELANQVPELDAVIVPIGGGGLCAGVATAFKLIRPECTVIGVEPKGADTMHRSFASGRPEAISVVRTIADSLGAPHTAPYSLKLCRENVDQLVLIDDRMMCRAMAVLFRDMKLVCEPAGAAATAALFGPLRKSLAGKRVGVVVCGSNIDLGSFVRYVDAGLGGIDPTLGIRPRTTSIKQPHDRPVPATPPPEASDS